MKKLILISVSLILSSMLVAGCNVLSGETKIDEGIVIAPKEKIRSSTAMVALDLAEVKRGDRLEILEQAEVKTPTQTDEWYKVRTIGKDDIIGWIKARYVINKSVVDKMNALLDKSKAIPAQGVGHLKVRTPLRMEPGGEVATYLSRSTSVEVVGKARTTFKPEKQQTDDADEETEEPETRTVLWYQVRLPRLGSAARRMGGRAASTTRRARRDTAPGRRGAQVYRVGGIRSGEGPQGRGEE